jgi:hypothetical protein
LKNRVGGSFLLLEAKQDLKASFFLLDSKSLHSIMFMFRTVAVFCRRETEMP